MSPQELLSSQRTVYVLAEKPGIDDTTAKPYWSLKLEGLHPDQLIDPASMKLNQAA